MSNQKTSFKERVLATIERFKMVAPGELILVAVSGGLDSVVLLDILLNLKDEMGINITLFHLDHMLRGEESKADAKFVQDLAKKNGLTIKTYKSDVGTLAEEKGLSLEEAAREVRYNLMTEAAERIGAQRVALGHSADDRVETFFINLIRGSGLKGLSSIPPVRDIFIRPLIEVFRDEIEAHAKKKALKYRYDSSNQNQAFLRNRVRFELIPLLLSYNPSLKEVILGNIEVIRGDEALLEQLAKVEFERLARLSEGMAALPFAALEKLAKPISLRVIRLAIEWVKGDLKAIESGHIEGIFEPKPSVLRRDLPGGIVIMEEGDSLLVIERKLLEGASEAQIEFEVKDGGLACNLDFEFKSSIIELSQGRSPLKKDDFKKEGGPFAAHFDLDLLESKLVIRGWRPADRFKPLNLDGFKKLQDLFVDNKLAKRLRSRVPIITSGGQIIWVVGHRLDDRFKVTDNTKRVLKLEAWPKA